MALEAILLDTSTYSGFKRGQGEVLELVRAAEHILLPAVVIGRLLAGFEAGSRLGRNRNELEAFCDTPRVTIPRSRGPRPSATRPSTAICAAPEPLCRPTICGSPRWRWNAVRRWLHSTIILSGSHRC